MESMAVLLTPAEANHIGWESALCLPLEGCSHSRWVGGPGNAFMAAGFLEEVALGLTQGQFPGSG